MTFRLWRCLSLKLAFGNLLICLKSRSPFFLILISEAGSWQFVDLFKILIFKVGSWQGGDEDPLRAEQAGGNFALRGEEELQRRQHPAFLKVEFSKKSFQNTATSGFSEG